VAARVGCRRRPASTCRPEAQGRRALADAESVDIRLHEIIYEVIAEVKAAMEGCCPESARRSKAVGGPQHVLAPGGLDDRGTAT